MTHALRQAPPLGNEALRQFVNTTDGVYVCASKSTDLVSPLLMARGWQPRFVASVDNSLISLPAPGCRPAIAAASDFVT